MYACIHVCVYITKQVPFFWMFAKMKSGIWSRADSETVGSRELGLFYRYNGPVCMTNSAYMFCTSLEVWKAKWWAHSSLTVPSKRPKNVVESVCSKEHLLTLNIHFLFCKFHLRFL